MGLFGKVLPSSPVPATYSDLPVDMDDWTCADFKIYYQRNVTAIGKTKALQIADMDAEKVGLTASLHWCQYDCDWVNYFKNEGLNVSNIITSVYCGTSNVINNAVQTVENTSGTIANVTGAAKSFTGSKVLVILAGAAILYGIYHIATTDNKQNLKYLL